MAFPNIIDAPDTSMQGTTLLATDDHALNHRTLGSAVIGIETNLGTNSGTSILKNFTVGNFAARQNQESFGSPTITGGTIIGQVQNNGTIANGLYGTAFLQGGTLANVSIGTPTILNGTVIADGTTAPFSFGAAVTSRVATIADPGSAGTFSPNAQSAQTFEISFGTSVGNRTLGTPLNPTNGEIIRYRVKQNAAATGTIVWASSIYRFSDAGTPVLGTASTWNYFGWCYSSTDSKWDYIGNSKNLI